ncbi:MAG TPA: T9SS type A sorting domain-containing protein, partial [bacterium]|nr:T9SS type A sorting domain-containing protein [bacterium]
TPGDARDVVLQDAWAYVADGLGGVQIIDVSNSNLPVIVAAMDTPGFAHDVALSNNTLYVADEESGIQVFDVAIPQSPIRLGNANTPGSCRGLAVSDDFVLLCDWTSGLAIFPRNCKTATSILESVVHTSARIHMAPNPMSSGGTHVSFEGLQRGNLDVAVFDVSGRRISTLFHGPATDVPRGIFWDGNSSDGPLPPGVYFLKLETGGKVRSEKLTIVR